MSYINKGIRVGKEDLKSWEFFTRQRRNLLITSVVLWFVTYHGIQPNKVLNFFGFTINFEEPINAPLILFVMVFYFLLRYYQFASGHWYKHVAPTLRDITEHLAIQFALKDWDAQVIADGNKPAKDGSGKISQKNPIGLGREPVPGKGILSKEISVIEPPYRIWVKGDIHPEGIDLHLTSAEKCIELLKPEEYCVRFYRWVILSWKTPSVTEFFFPPLVAYGALLYSAYKLSQATYLLPLLNALN